MSQIRKRPKLGQHFLTSDAYRRRVAEALPLRADDFVIEIGPGRGAMTAIVAGGAGRLLAIELDSHLAAQLRADFAGDDRVEVLQGDILQMDLAAICWARGAERAFVFGNLPYYITSPILHHLLASASFVRGMAFVVQREVAERIAARPGSRAYGYLSVLAQVYSKPDVLFSIPPGAFSPAPAVFSALVGFEMISQPLGWNEAQLKEFLRFVKLAFASKRKTLANSLSPVYPRAAAQEALRRLGFGKHARAEELAVDDLGRLFEHMRGQAANP